jgi:hypothetical protein
LHRIAFPVVSEWCQYHAHVRPTPSSTGGQPDSTYELDQQEGLNLV